MMHEEELAQISEDIAKDRDITLLTSQTDTALYSWGYKAKAIVVAIR